MVPFRYVKRRLQKMIREGEYAEAIRYGRDAEPGHADDRDFMFIMGSIHMIVDEPHNAIPYFEKALRIDGSDVESLKLKTNAHLAMGQREEAARSCGMVLDLSPGDPEAAALLDELSG